MCAHEGEAMIRQSSVLACIVSGALGCVTSDPGAPPADTTPQPTFKQAAAARAAAVLGDPAVRAATLDLLRQRGSVALAELPRLAAVAADSADPTAVPEAWLLEPAGGSADLVVAYAPAGSEHSWTAIPAYTLDGARIAIDAHRAPDAAVVVIETHGRLAMQK